MHNGVGVPEQETHDFSWALHLIKRKKKLSREGWNGKGMYLTMKSPDEYSDSTHPYLDMHVPGCAEGLRVLPWQPAQVDLFAEDWGLVE